MFVEYKMTHVMTKSILKIKWLSCSVSFVFQTLTFSLCVVAMRCMCYHTKHMRVAGSAAMPPTIWKAVAHFPFS